MPTMLRINKAASRYATAALTNGAITNQANKNDPAGAARNAWVITSAEDSGPLAKSS
jgi:hypothetical protein